MIFIVNRFLKAIELSRKRVPRIFLPTISNEITLLQARRAHMQGCQQQRVTNVYSRADKFIRPSIGSVISFYGGYFLINPNRFYETWLTREKVRTPLANPILPLCSLSLFNSPSFPIILCVMIIISKREKILIGLDLSVYI